MLIAAIAAALPSWWSEDARLFDRPRGLAETLRAGTVPDTGPPRN